MPVRDLLNDLLSDLRAETSVLEGILTGLTAGQWESMTPAEGWSVGDHVTHLAYFDQSATMAAVDAAAFRDHAKALDSHGPNFSAWVASEYRAMAPAEQHQWFRRARGQLVSSFEEVDPTQKLPWFGPQMSPASSLTARLMETWAHSQDIAEAVAVPYPQSNRIHHIAYLGVRTFNFSFQVHGLPVPDSPISVRLLSPDGSQWAWGDADAQDAVEGPAVDFCRVVTQRRALAETDLIVKGPVATEWLSIAQAFAGPATTTSPRRGKA
jgi:uncharacterized protein (TIGR03084 family)